MEEYHSQGSGNTPDAPENEKVLIMWRVISRHDWDMLQRFQRMHPRCTVEHLYAGLYVVQVPSKALPKEAA